ncbi:MAG: DUF2334 domain-containing protein [Deltaproteobacteria bacterium]|nr:DUF2334 domain-containing protein [Deltaproteobacteria bacterium]
MSRAKDVLKMTVEVHDVTPALWPEVHSLVHQLTCLGVPHPTLLVVPEYEEREGRRWDLREQPHFVEWLKGLAESGAEIVQHGLTHRASGPHPGGIRAALMHHVYSRGCAEFADLDFISARKRLRRGRRILEDCGLTSLGFVAPAWQQSEQALAAVAAEGFAYSAFFDSLWTAEKPNQRVYAPGLTFAAGHSLVDYGKRIYMRGVERLAAKEPLLRVALHPEDARLPGLVPHILRRISALRERRELTDYSTFLGARLEAHHADRALAAA